MAKLVPALHARPLRARLPGCFGPAPDPLLAIGDTPIAEGQRLPIQIHGPYRQHARRTGRHMKALAAIVAGGGDYKDISFGTTGYRVLKVSFCLSPGRTAAANSDHLHPVFHGNRNRSCQIQLTAWPHTVRRVGKTGTIKPLQRGAIPTTEVPGWPKTMLAIDVPCCDAGPSPALDDTRLSTTSKSAPAKQGCEAWIGPSNSASRIEVSPIDSAHKSVKPGKCCVNCTQGCKLGGFIDDSYQQRPSIRGRATAPSGCPAGSPPFSAKDGCRVHSSTN